MGYYVFLVDKGAGRGYGEFWSCYAKTSKEARIKFKKQHGYLALGDRQIICVPWDNVKWTYSNRNYNTK